MRPEGDDGEQAEQNWRSAEDGLIGPRALSFDTEMSDLDLPATDEPSKDVAGLSLEISSEKGLGLVHLCVPGYEGARAFVAQSGSQVNLVSESGDGATGYIEWPRRIWSDTWDKGAMVSPDGIKIQFDDGTVWIREMPVVHYRP